MRGPLRNLECFSASARGGRFDPFAQRLCKVADVELEIVRALRDQTAGLSFVLNTWALAGRMGKNRRRRPPRPGERRTVMAARGLELCNFIEHHGRVGVLRTSELLMQRQGAPIQCLGLFIAALGPVHIGQLSRSGGHIGMLFTDGS